MKSTRVHSMDKNYLTHELGSEWVSERASESSGAREKSEQCEASE